MLLFDGHGFLALLPRESFARAAMHFPICSVPPDLQQSELAARRYAQRGSRVLSGSVTIDEYAFQSVETCMLDNC